MSRIDPTLSGPVGARSSVVERLADLYGSQDKKSPLGASGRSRRGRGRRSRKGGYSYYGGAPKKSALSRWVVVLVILAVLVAGLGVIATQMKWLSVDAAGIEEGDIIRGDQLEHLEFRLRVQGRAKGDVVVMLNGVEVPTTVDAKGVIVVSLASAAPGVNRVNYRVKSTLPWVKDKTGQVAFTVRFGPTLSVPRAVPPPTDRRGALIRGLADDDVIVTVNGKPAKREAGMFEITVPKGAREAVVVATDAEGNTTKATVAFDATPVVAPEPVQAFHLSEQAWRYTNLDKTLSRLAAEKRINAVVMTVKDEYGIIGYPTQVPLAKEINAIGKDWRVSADGSLTLGFYDARQVIDRLHALGLKAIGRITCFLDPQLAEWAYKNGKTSMMVMGADGQPIRTAYGTAVFTNFADPAVKQYNIDLAVEAANLGFDEIMFDYVRRPEGLLKNLVFPGLDVAPQVGIANFVREARQALPPQTKLGVAVFGVSASRPNLVGQDIRLLAPLVDYIAPMVYPSHWVTGEYKVPIPLAEPGKIVERSTADFVRQASTGGAYTVPWIQDFDSGQYLFGPDQVMEQADGAYKGNASGVFVWNSKIEYDWDGLRPMNIPDPKPIDGPASTVATTTTVR